MSNKPYASALNKAPHLLHIVDVINTRMDLLDMQVQENRVYLIDEVRASALYFLAQQFNVLGYKGWILAEGEQERRDLIKRAIELHRYKGTPWAVKESIRSLGFNDVTLIERVGLITNYYNGAIIHNGAEVYGGEDTGEWATFSVIINGSNWSQAIDGNYVTALLALIDEYKNVRSHLIDVILRLDFEDSMDMLDDDSMGNDVELEDELDMTLNYDGTATYSGVYDHDLTSDSLSLDIEAPTTTVITYAAVEGEEEVSINIDLPVGTVINWGDGMTTTVGADEFVFAHTYGTSGEERTVSFLSDGATFMNPCGISTNVIKNITGLPSTLAQLYITAHEMVEIDLSNITNLTKFECKNGPLQSVVMPEDAPNIDSFDISYNTMSVANLSDLIILIDSYGGSNGTFDSRYQTPPAPITSGEVINSIIALYDRSWSVLYDF